jgi:hypothetical protein
MKEGSARRKTQLTIYRNFLDQNHHILRISGLVNPKDKSLKTVCSTNHQVKHLWNDTKHCLSTQSMFG